MTSKIYLIVGAVVVLILLAGGGYYLWSLSKAPTDLVARPSAPLVATPSQTPPTAVGIPVVKIDQTTTTETKLAEDDANLDKEFQKLDADTQGANTGLNDKSIDLSDQ